MVEVEILPGSALAKRKLRESGLADTPLPGGSSTPATLSNRSRASALP